MAPPDPAVKVVPANEASWEDLQTVLGARGPASRCRSQRYKTAPARIVRLVPSRGARPAAACLFVRAGFRRRGVSGALARAAVEFARERGARALEGHPMTTKNAIAEELHPGTDGVFADAGLAEIGRPTPRRAVMRIDF